MVRLKEESIKFHSSKVNVFQFHYGAIKSSVRMHRKKIQYRNFNSTMVRLKEGILEDNAESLGNFNSTMVRLKVAGKLTLYRCFNRISIPLWCD